MILSIVFARKRIIFIATLLYLLFAYGVFGLHPFQPMSSFAQSTQALLTDPFLQLPTQDAVYVVWFTEFEGTQHWVEYGENLRQTVEATTNQLSRTREDVEPALAEDPSAPAPEPVPGRTRTIERPIWRHEAHITGLPTNQKQLYRVISVNEPGNKIESDRFLLASAPTAATPLKILLTSDHQLKPMTAANLQKVIETVGQVDAVFFAGDLVDTPDRASEWFDHAFGNAFFPCLQGRASYDLKPNGSETTTRYHGGALIQSAPLFPTIGNHEVMGRVASETTLYDQFNDPLPRQIASQLYAQVAEQVNPTHDPAIEQAWIKDHSFNTDTYEEIFTLPSDSPGGKKYYALTFGDIRLISLYITNIWRTPSLSSTVRGRYRERDADLNDPARWGYGQHIFESIAPGSPQFEWLKAELARPEFQQAKYKIVMFHHPPHSLGDNIVPAFTDPVQQIDRLPNGQIQAVRYEYPIASDYLMRDVVPLLEAAGVHLVFFGHSHLWNRFVSPGGMHFLETSNVGNTYGAFTETENKRRPIPIGFDETYIATGDPNGLLPVMPTIAPLTNEAGQPQPFIASNTITAFSILDTATGTISSYRFDTRQPDGAVVKFDEFQLGRG